MRNPGYGSKMPLSSLPDILLLFLERRIKQSVFQELYSRLARKAVSKWMQEHLFRDHSLHFSELPITVETEI
jgi:hypothetical protein